MSTYVDKNPASTPVDARLCLIGAILIAHQGRAGMSACAAKNPASTPVDARLCPIGAILIAEN
jgi:hypothetical protein